MAKPEKTDNPRKAGGRLEAPGQNKTHTFINASGDTRVETMNWFHDEGKAAGWTPADDDTDDDDVPVEEPV